MKIDWSTTYAAIWRAQKLDLRPIKYLDPIRLHQLIGIDKQKHQLMHNTRCFIQGQQTNNVLLWGARGTGKSSLIKALLNEYLNQGLRIIEFGKDDLIHLPDVVDDIRDLPQRFIVYCDDLSFNRDEGVYKVLKSVLEGSIEQPPENVVLYATSNRRHLLPEHFSDNQQTRITSDEIHYSDTVEELQSLSDRFGMWISFYATNMETYLAVVDAYFPNFTGKRDELHAAARTFALDRACHSGRTAKQFYLYYSNINRPTS